MLIRSQDGEKIVNLNNITRIDVKKFRDGMNVWASSIGITSLLGTYSNEEKALKVLDMICNRYQAIWDVENACISGGGINFDSVFYMPQDSEV